MFLEKNQAKGDQYGWRNNEKLSAIPNNIHDEDLETTVIKICKKFGINVEVRDTEGCHRLSLSLSQEIVEFMIKG